MDKIYEIIERMNNKELGKWGEEYAVEYLRRKGYQVLETNWHYSKYGEIDIICLFEKRLTFVEVKTRRNSHAGYPLESITKAKYHQIKKLANAYLYLHDNLFVRGFRIEVVGVLVENQEITLKHLKNP
jgi:putative endonuclease